MKKSFLVGILVCFSMIAFGQQSMEWYTYWGSNVAGNQIEPQRMVVDNDGNIYVAALFGGTKVAVESQTIESNSSADKGDAVIVKMSPAKLILWAYPIVSLGKATATDLALDQKGNIVVTGAFNNAIRVGEETMKLDDSNMGEEAIYVLRLTAAGQAIDAWQIPAMGAKGGSVAIDGDDNIVISGLLDGDATFVPGGDPEGDFSNSAQFFLAKYSNEGELLWHQFRNDAGESTYGRPYLALDENDDMYVAVSLNGKTNFGNAALSCSVNNAILLAYDAEGNEKWCHMIEGDEADDAAAIAVSPIGQVAIAVNHHSPELHIDDLSDVFKHEYVFDAQYAHAAFFSFDLNGDFKWFYEWGYSNDTSGSDAPCYSLRCTDEGVWYAVGMMTGRLGGSRLPGEDNTLPAGKNSGVETIDHQWLTHNTNGGHDCYLITLTRGGKLANVIRPGGPQYEDGMDVALSPDKKSLYFLQTINVRDQAPYTCPDNIFDSWTDLYAPADWESRKANYTILTVYCPENDGSGANYGKDYKGIFTSSLLVKYALPVVDPEVLPNFVVGEPYSQDLAIATPKGKATLFPLEQSSDVEFDGLTVSGTFATEAVRFTGFIAIDSIALPGQITYYSYDSETKRSLRSNPRTVRYMPLTVKEEQGIEDAAEDPKAVGRKMMREGILYIERNGRIYNAQGAEVK